MKLTPSDEPESGLSLLRACHGRARHFGELARRLASAGTERPELVRDAAAGVHRYFTVALPLHFEDEEQLLEPAVRARAGTRFAELFARLESEHVRFERALAELRPRWLELITHPERLASMEALGALTRDFTDALEAHAQLEERELFPAAEALLGRDELEALLGQMRSRRQGP